MRNLAAKRLITENSCLLELRVIHKIMGLERKPVDR